MHKFIRAGMHLLDARQALTAASTKATCKRVAGILAAVSDQINRNAGSTPNTPNNDGSLRSFSILQIVLGWIEMESVILTILLAMAAASDPLPPDCASWGFNEPACADCDTISSIVQDEELTDQCRQCCM